MTRNKNIIQTFAITGLSGLVLALAAPSALASEIVPGGGSILLGIQQAIQSGTDALSNEIDAFAEQIQQLSLAEQESNNSYRYQNDPQLASIASNTVGASSATASASSAANELSNQNVVDALQPMSYAALETSTNDGVALTDTAMASEASDKLTTINNAVKDHSWGITASDSLFANYNFVSPGTMSNYKIDGTKVDPVYQGQPTLHDDYLSFANFFEPTSLNYDDTDGGITSAQQYLDFLTGSYQPIYSQLINLDTLNDTISSANKYDSSNQITLGTTASSIVRKLATSKKFQKMQTVVRQSTAQASIGMYTLNNILSERQAIVSTVDIPELDAIAKNMGIEVKTSDDEWVYPSKAQIDYYQSHHDLNNEAWYQNLQTLSGPNVERESLITLKQIQLSLAQQHTDNETIAALLAVSNIQNSQTALMSMTQIKQSLQSWLENMSYDDVKSPDEGGAAGAPG